MKPCPQPPTPRRSFGGRTIGRIHGLRWSEAGIAAQVVPPQSSRWTVREGQRPTCRPADLPTCRIWVLDFSDSSEVSPAFKSKAGKFTASFSSRPRLPSQGPAIVRTSSPLLPRGAIFLNSPFPTGNSEEPLRSYCFIQTTEFP